jgi:hypothetical protein
MKDGVAGEFFECKRVASAEHSTTWPWSKIWTDLDHTADVQLHAWGGSFEESLQHLSQCLSNFVTDLSTVLVEPSQSIIFTVQGHDPQSMLYNFMDELLFRFSAFVVPRSKSFWTDKITPSMWLRKTNYNCPCIITIQSRLTHVSPLWTSHSRKGNKLVTHVKDPRSLPMLVWEEQTFLKPFPLLWNCRCVLHIFIVIYMYIIHMYMLS